MKGYPLLTPEQKREIIGRIKEKGERVADLAKEYGVQPRIIYGYLSRSGQSSGTLLELSKLKREKEALLKIVGQLWVLDIVNAVPSQSKTKENMRGADKGIDGVINFVKDIANGKQEYGRLLVQVKGGGVHRDDIATLKGDIEREKADGGVFITLEPPTQPMKREAVSAGSYKVKFSPAEFPKIQILTIDDLLNNKEPKVPLTVKPYYKEAKKFEGDKLKNQRKLVI